MGLLAYARALADSGVHLVEALAKARGFGANPTANAVMAQSGRVSGKSQANVGTPRSTFQDPLRTQMGTGWRERFYGNSFDITRELIADAPIIAVIISTRANECLPFGRRSLGRFMPGFKVRLRDVNERPTDASLRRADELADFIEHTGDPGNSALRDRFPTYLYKQATATLSIAQHGTEVVRDRGGKPNQFYSVDAATLRHAQHAAPNVSEDIEEEVRYVQVVDGRIVTAYTQRDLIFTIRNPTSDIRMAGYGVSEIEKVQRAVAAILETWQYNVRAFTQGTNIRGIMNLKEPLNKPQFEDFREDFYAWARGVENAHTTNVMNAPAGFDYTDLSRSNRDLEYGEWTNFLIRIICSAYNISTESIGFSYGNIGQSSALSEQNNEYKITAAKERGLRPLLANLFEPVQEIISQLDDNFVVEPVGLDQMTPEQADQHDQARVRTMLTVNEIRAEDGRGPDPSGGGDVILDPTYLAARNMFGGQGFGPPGQPGPPQDQPPGQDGPADQPTEAGQADQQLDMDGPDGDAADVAESTAKSLRHTWHLNL